MLLFSPQCLFIYLFCSGRDKYRQALEGEQNEVGVVTVSHLFKFLCVGHGGDIEAAES